MHLRHIDPRSTDWLDAMVDEVKAEAESEKEAMGAMGDSPVSASPEAGTESRTVMAAAPPR